jgi:hypothetical protein
MSAFAGDFRYHEYGSHKKRRFEHSRLLPHTVMIALIVPLLLLFIAIRRNSGVLAAFILLMLFAARM